IDDPALSGARRSVLRHRQSADCAFGVVRETDAPYAIRRAQPSVLHDLTARVAADDGTVDRALDAILMHAHGDVLRDGLALACCLVDCVMRFAAAAVQLEGLWAEAAHDEVARTVRGAVEVALVRATDVVTGDDDAVGV